MEKEKAIEILNRQIDCYKTDGEECLTLATCSHCEHNVTREELIEAMQTAISALEKQSVDKCCETCKYKNRSAREIPCCDCYMESCFEDCYEPYTEEEE